MTARALGRKIRAARKRLGVSIDDVRKTTHVSTMCIERAESGRVVSPWILRALCRMFDIEGGPVSDAAPTRKRRPKTKRKRKPK